MIKNPLPIIFLLFILSAKFSCVPKQPPLNNDYVSYEVDLKQQDLKLYWKDDKGQIFKSIGNLKSWLERKGHRLVFAMNAGMYRQDNTPQGLFIQNYKVLVPPDTSSGNGNFYLKPNGVFFTTQNNQAVICRTDDFRSDSTIKYATQSGPILIIDGQIHSAFKKNSRNLNIRNGVGVLPNGKVLFAMSKKEVNLYDFAGYFKNHGCKQALYFDGLVSRTYLPEEEWIQTDGNFGVMVGVTQ